MFGLDIKHAFDFLTRVDDNETQADNHYYTERENSRKELHNRMLEIANDPNTDPQASREIFILLDRDSERRTKECLSRDNVKQQKIKSIEHVGISVVSAIVFVLGLKHFKSDNHSNDLIAQNDDDATVYKITDKEQNRRSS